MMNESDLAEFVNGYAEHEHLAIRQDIYKRFNEPRGINFFEWVLDRVALRGGERVLDVGCGNGAFHPALIERGCEIVSLDYSPAIVDFLRRADAAGNARIVCASGDAIPLKSGCCGAALANFMLHYFSSESRQNVLREMKRVVKPGGKIVSANFGPDLISRLRAMHHEAAKTAGVAADTSDFHIFNMSSIAEWTELFPDVRMEILPSKLVVNDVRTLLRYYSSFLLDKVLNRTADNVHRRPMVAWMAHQLATIIASEGQFEDPTSTGVFIATA